MSSRKRLRAQKLARLADATTAIKPSNQLAEQRYEQRQAAAEKHRVEQARIRAEKFAQAPRVTGAMKADHRRIDMRTLEPDDIDALGAPKISEHFAMYLDGTRNTRYRAALRELMQHAPAQAAAYTTMFTSKTWHYDPHQEREACAAEELHITVSLFRRRLWAAVRFVIGAAEGNVPSVVQRYAQERARAISAEARRSRSHHWARVRREGDASLCTKWG